MAETFRLLLSVNKTQCRLTLQLLVLGEGGVVQQVLLGLGPGGAVRDVGHVVQNVFQSFPVSLP